ncbi:general secretion pathway protein [Stenotrophomonas geniculata]|uniref:General secretion pathway protein n=1 Tax=Stenotrophomonas geniculata N1 TaxID=1167641 RepID=A0A0L8AD76_9GAMM|nr:general secretion pathway protein [Stenotrophomonas geniculata]KOF00177.1 general secretion pathway protein [Stenotrophomonas geniculata N1]
MDGRRWDRNRILTLLAATLLLAVVAYWGVTLSAVAPAAAASEAKAVAPAAAASEAKAVAPVRPMFDAVASLPLVRLLSPGAVQTEVVVLGVMAGDHAPLALLSVDGRPAEAYAPGQRLGPCTVLASISASAVELNQAGQSRSLPVPELPPVPSDGIVPAAL